MVGQHDAVDDIRKRAVDLHDGQAGLFEAWYGRMEGSDHHASAFLYGRKKIDDLLYPWLDALPKGSKVLDIGCGTGEQIRRIRERGYEVKGVEPAPAMRQKAIANNPGSEIVDGTSSALPFDRDSFDAVICIEVLRYLHQDDITKSYQEMLRVLKPGGELLVTLVNLFALDGFFVFDSLRRARDRFSGRNESPHCEFVTPRRVRKELIGLGAENVRAYGRLFGPIRIAYKLGDSLGEPVAKLLSGLDDRFSRLSWTTPFGGHLVVIAAKPGPSK